MPIPDSRSKYKRTNLFLLRVWCDDPDQNENKEKHEHEQGDEHENKGEGSGLMWHGKLQKTVSGETHSFNGREGLIEVLETMLYKDQKDQPEHNRPWPPGKTSSEADLPASGNNQTKAKEGAE